MKNATYEAHRNDFLDTLCKVELQRADPALWLSDAPMYNIVIHCTGRTSPLYITACTSKGYKLSADYTYAKPYTYRTATDHYKRLLQSIVRAEINHRM